ncbi:hypothetical protein D3C78_1258490 [compost metagenome]
MTLRPPALADIGRFGHADFAGQLDNGVGRYPGDTSRPLWRFGDAIVTLAEDIGFVMAVFWRAAG